MRGVADGAGNFADSHLRGSVMEARDVALIFRKPVGNFQTERDGLGVNAVGAADLRGVAEFVRAQIEDFPEHHEGAFDQPGSVDRKSTRLNSSHSSISYAVFCLK